MVFGGGWGGGDGRFFGYCLYPIIEKFQCLDVSLYPKFFYIEDKIYESYKLNVRLQYFI